MLEAGGGRSEIHETRSRRGDAYFIQHGFSEHLSESLFEAWSIFQSVFLERLS
jgi:hypothetical protein